MNAAARGYGQIIRVLAEAGADVNYAEPAHGQTALRVAAAQRRHGAIAALLDLRADPNAEAAGGATPLMEAAEATDAEAVRMLLGGGADPALLTPAGTALIRAAAAGDPDVVAMLLDSGADPDQRSPYHRATSPLLVAAAAGNAGVVELLLRAGASIEVANVVGATPLIKAARGGSADCVAVLLDAGAVAGSRDVFGRTAADYAAEARRADVLALLGGAHQGVARQ